MSVVIPRIAVITAHNRQELLLDCIQSLSAQVDRIIVIDNASDPPIRVPRSAHRSTVLVVRDPEQPPNLSKLWNRGLELADYAAQAMLPRPTEWDIGIFGDDVLVPPDWWFRVGTAIRVHGCVAGATHGILPQPVDIIKREIDHDITSRMPGWAWMLRGESAMRLDENLRWWWGDTDLDWRCRQAGGVVIAAGEIAVNQRPNEYTVMKPELTRQAGLDRLTFSMKWGRVPW
jgi:glycosyltransferase involved in cell wall biosynthesis